MQYGFILPGGTAPEQVDQAVAAEEAGWDGVFVWEAAYGVDAWTLLAAMAARTTRIRLGTMLTPLPWRRPWKLASQVATLDQLSAGRAVLTIGLGAVAPELGRVAGEPLDRRTRAARLDEGIDLMRAMWDGTLRYEGQQYDVDLTAGREGLFAAARPVQARIPIWVVGAWPAERSMRRVLRCDGIVPALAAAAGPHQVGPTELREIRAWLDENGAPADLDVVCEGETSAADRDAAADQVAPYGSAGATWWLEARWTVEGGPGESRRVVTERIAAGPPRVD